MNTRNKKTKEKEDSIFKEYYRIRKELKKDKIYCERCYKLQNYLNFEGKNVNKYKINKYTLLARQIDPKKLIDKIFSKIPPGTNIFYVFDIYDIESTITKDLLTMISKKNLKVIFIANKFDVLPKYTSDDRLRMWVGEKLREICKDNVI